MTQFAPSSCAYFIHPRSPPAFSSVRLGLQYSISLVIFLPVLSFDLLGYVSGISGLCSSPNILRIGGTVNTVTGPKLPMTIEKKIAGFSIAAHRMYLMGCEKNLGTADIVSAQR
ncbi:hypothetical protein WAI453_011700 [Rhynchosporium graminicola]